MKAIIKNFDSSDVFDLKGYIPDQSNYFGFPLALHIGSSFEKGEDIFYVFICTPAFILSDFSETNFVWGRHMIIVFKYDWDEIFTAIKEKVEEVSSDTWGDVAHEINKYAGWEFENGSNYDIFFDGVQSTLKPLLVGITLKNGIELQDYLPDYKSNFSISVTLKIQSSDYRYSQDFELIVLTPQWMLANFSETDVIFTYQTLIVFEYKCETIFSAVQNIITDIEEPTWERVCKRIEKIAKKL